MTMIVVILIGAGAILIASSLDCTPIVQTFQKLIGGQPIDWTGSGVNCQQSGLTGSTSVSGVPTFPGASGTSPSGSPCTLATNASQTAVEVYCACVAGYTSPPLMPDSSSKYQAYKSCLVQNSTSTTA